MFQNPFNCATEELPPNLHLEVISLQCNDMLKGKYQEKNLTEFCKCLSSDEYTQLKSHDFGLLSVFGSTYHCERHFQR